MKRLYSYQMYWELSNHEVSGSHCHVAMCETNPLANTSTTKTKTLRETNLHVKSTVRYISLLVLIQTFSFLEPSYHIFQNSRTLPILFYMTVNWYFYNLIWWEHCSKCDQDVWKGKIYKLKWRKKNQKSLILGKDRNVDLLSKMKPS